MKNLITEDDQARAFHYFLACLFARVAGKSKTDYLGSVLEEKIKSVLTEIFLNKIEVVITLPLIRELVNQIRIN